MSESKTPKAFGLAKLQSYPPWQGKEIATHKLRLLELSMFVEYGQEPKNVRFLIP